MKIKSIKSKIGRLHYVEVGRVLKHPKGDFRKEFIQFILTDVDAKKLHKILDQKFGKEEHLLAIPIPKKEDESEKTIPLFGMV